MRDVFILPMFHAHFIRQLDQIEVWVDQQQYSNAELSAINMQKRIIGLHKYAFPDYKGVFRALGLKGTLSAFISKLKNSDDQCVNDLEQLRTYAHFLDFLDYLYSAQVREQIKRYLLPQSMWMEACNGQRVLQPLITPFPKDDFKVYDRIIELLKTLTAEELCHWVNVTFQTLERIDDCGMQELDLHKDNVFNMRDALIEIFINFSNAYKTNYEDMEDQSEVQSPVAIC